ncbi:MULTISPECIES: SAM-dependent methyltransferase [unclassified Solwaraspora]|uniref:class I SAM-dependent methyltransferase n=1 Tax=unclassified Solwaraspora TaxID=2627926 RepID=UPI00248AC7AB|nr:MULTISPECIES: SAM-dependent methyltransferase [unclassified Solwaraspora]WBC00445.1 SAM-dependent methyltransferase [Solwaraspora sp. WMMA2059]WBC23948.1 SAM-dependent methyltransferase [Solwaraspora sp. WMMA2080]WJK37824.1 SAM-dependent methyltransferase [Solwaraspora sp. WMMA2065]
MTRSLADALDDVRALLLSPQLTRAVAAGRRRNAAPSVVRAELRPVALRAGTHLQIVTNDGTRPVTRNLPPGAPAEAAVDQLLAEPFGNWHVETSTSTLQLRVTKKGTAQVHRSTADRTDTGPGDHDRAKRYLLDPDDPLFAAIGANAAKRRQVDAFLRALAATLPDPLPAGPLHVVDLGCGNAYLTFAAYRYLVSRGGQPVVTGVDVREDQRRRNTALADQLGCAGQVRFVAGTIRQAPVEPAPDLVLALHACDTATDEALARAVDWQARWVLAAPCCHHDIAAQLRRQPAPQPYGPLVSAGILRERFADVLTDTLRATLLRAYGYRVDVVEFIDSQHTPRNLLLRARRGGVPDRREQHRAYRALVDQWAVTPRLQTLLPAPPDTAGSAVSDAAGATVVSRP